MMRPAIPVTKLAYKTSTKTLNKYANITQVIDPNLELFFIQLKGTQPLILAAMV
jgi:hypothetical protein